MSSSPARLPSAEFEQLVKAAKDRHNLSDIIGRHTTLKARGRSEKVGLCPFHNERTPSFEVNDSNGQYYCHGCGKSGDAITFLMEGEGMTFRQAYEALAGDEFPVISEEERARRKAEDEEKMAERIAVAKEIWAASIPPKGTPAEVYLRSRGIVMDLPETVRFAMTPRWRNAETGEVGRDIPAVVFAMQDNSDDIVGVQCVFLEDGGRRKYERTRADGTKAKAKLTFGKLVGSAIRLGPVAEQIVYCEGPEDGLTLAQLLPHMSVWVSCGTAVMPRMIFPRAVQSLILAGDNNIAGRKAVVAARIVHSSQGLKVEEVFPDPPFKDWNDQLMGVRS
ncbi:CHC2 zinc finger domain-containing protein [Sphingopyxis terrae]|uniref:CHC2 zinc finger domain-containing protein n=1 Tax=Sphingopyxis terrae TaxID=33052 RepID=UPI000A56B5D2|nr:CHC2 zinc finger domain-containing protein [Sphingopyxis terrae]